MEVDRRREVVSKAIGMSVLEAREFTESLGGLSISLAS
jgi:hypothetical protein